MEEYPIYIDGESSGKLLVYKDGLMTVFRAQCGKTDRIIKLHVFGGGASKLLGTMLPDSNGQTLLRKVSRNEMKHFPQRIEYAAEREVKSDADTLWLSAPNGCLILSDDENSLIAIPADSTAIGLKLSNIRIINGREYILFPGKRKMEKL